jgi:hypothetical protein
VVDFIGSFFFKNKLLFLLANASCPAMSNGAEPYELYLEIGDSADEEERDQHRRNLQRELKELEGVTRVEQISAGKAPEGTRAQPRRFKNEWITVAEGEDGYNTYWHELFAPVMKQIESYIFAIEEHELDLDWKEICASVPALNGRDWDIPKEQTWSSFLVNLEFEMDCNLLESVWEGGMPGKSGHNFELELKASQKQSFIQTMEQFLTSLEKYWKEHELPELN